MERTDTRGEGIPVGHHTFRVSELPVKKYFQGGSAYYEFRFEATVNGQIKKHQENIPVWLVAPLLRALGAKEVESEVFEWEPEDVNGMQFDGEILMEPSKKDGKEYRRLKNPHFIGTKSSAASTEEVPF